METGGKYMNLMGNSVNT